MANDADRRHKPEWAQELAVKLETVGCHVEGLSGRIEAVEMRLGSIETTLTETRIEAARGSGAQDAKARMWGAIAGCIPATLAIGGLWLRSLFTRGS